MEPGAHKGQVWREKAGRCTAGGPTTIPHQANMWTLLTKQLSNSFLKEKCPKGFNNIYLYSKIIFSAFTSSKYHRALEGTLERSDGESGDSLKCDTIHNLRCCVVTLLHETVPTKSIGMTHSINYVLIQYSCFKIPRCTSQSASQVDEGKVKLSLTLH